MQFPELDLPGVDFVNQMEANLSQYGFGLGWYAIKKEAKDFAAELNSWGIMSDKDYSNFKARNWYVGKLKNRHDLKHIKLQGEFRIISGGAV